MYVFCLLRITRTTKSSPQHLWIRAHIVPPDYLTCHCRASIGKNRTDSDYIAFQCYPLVLVNFDQLDIVVALQMVDSDLEEHQMSRSYWLALIRWRVTVACSNWFIVELIMVGPILHLSVCLQVAENRTSQLSEPPASHANRFCDTVIHNRIS